MIFTVVGWVCGFAILGTFLYANITDRYEAFNWTNVVTAFFLVPINISRDAAFGAAIGIGFACASIVWLIKHYFYPRPTFDRWEQRFDYTGK